VATNTLSRLPMLLIAAGGLVVGLALPAAAHETGRLINGTSIAVHSIPGDRLKQNTVTGMQIDEGTLGTVRRATTAAKLRPLTWHLITHFVVGDGWENAGHGLPRAAYAVDGQGVVHLRGALKNTNGTVYDTEAFTLPASVLSSSVDVSLPFADGNSGYTGTLWVDDGVISPMEPYQVTGPDSAAAIETDLGGLVFPGR
jgi:hypothetical protein